MWSSLVLFSFFIVIYFIFDYFIKEALLLLPSVGEKKL